MIYSIRKDNCLFALCAAVCRVVLCGCRFLARFWWFAPAGFVWSGLFCLLFYLISDTGVIVIKALEEKILKEGKVFPGNILKVGGFLNHRIDVPFVMEMGKEIADIYKGCEINKILTIETSGIPIAFAAAQHLNVPVVFAKKNKSANISGDVYSEDVASFTHKTVSKVIVSREFLTPDDKVLIVDDFLAAGNALNGLINICNEAGAEVVGCAIAIEKAFQDGGEKIRYRGVRVESLAIVESMSDDSITFRRG